MKSLKRKNEKEKLKKKKCKNIHFKLRFLEKIFFFIKAEFCQKNMNIYATAKRKLLYNHLTFILQTIQGDVLEK